MTAEHTVTVHTVDHGPVTLLEPAWCVGAAVHPDGGFRDDIAHEGIELLLEVTPGGRRVVLARAALEERPFTRLVPGRAPFVSLEVGGDWYPCRPGDLRRVAGELVAQAAWLRVLADHLTDLTT